MTRDTAQCRRTFPEHRVVQREIQKQPGPSQLGCEGLPSSADWASILHRRQDQHRRVRHACRRRIERAARIHDFHSQLVIVLDLVVHALTGMLYQQIDRQGLKWVLVDFFRIPVLPLGLDFDRLVDAFFAFR